MSIKYTAPGFEPSTKKKIFYSFLTSGNFFPKDFPLLTSSSTKTPGQFDQIWRNLAKVAIFLSLWPNILRVYLVQRFELTQPMIDSIWEFFTVANGQKLNKASGHLVTLNLPDHFYQQINMSKVQERFFEKKNVKERIQMWSQRSEHDRQ